MVSGVLVVELFLIIILLLIKFYILNLLNCKTENLKNFLLNSSLNSSQGAQYLKIIPPNLIKLS